MLKFRKLKKLLKKVLVLPLCALITTPFSAVFANVPGEPGANVQNEAAENRENVMNNIIESGELFRFVDNIIGQRAEPDFTRDPELRGTFEEKISEYRRLFNGANLSDDDKNSLRRFFGTLGLSMSNSFLSGTSFEGVMGQFMGNIANADLRIREIFRRLEGDGAGILPFVADTVGELSDNPNVCGYFLTQCFRIALA